MGGWQQGSDSIELSHYRQTWGHPEAPRHPDRGQEDVEKRMCVHPLISSCTDSKSDQKGMTFPVQFENHVTAIIFTSIKTFTSLLGVALLFLPLKAIWILHSSLRGRGHE